MRMYRAKQRARSPLSTRFPATLQLGNETSFSPACCASCLIPAGVMSGVPTICSCFKELSTVERPFSASTITAIPNAIRIAPETIPPISRILRRFIRLSFRGPSHLPPGQCRIAVSLDSGRTSDGGSVLRSAVAGSVTMVSSGNEDTSEARPAGPPAADEHTPPVQHHNVTEWHGRNLFDNAGEKIGRLED